MSIKAYYCSIKNNKLYNSFMRVVNSLLNNVKLCCGVKQYNSVITIIPRYKVYYSGIHPLLFIFFDKQFRKFKISNRINVCVGGNGYGAKSSDEIGRLGASVLQGESIDERFQPRFIG